MGKNTLVGLVAWIVGVLVALAVGAGMIVPRILIDGKLTPVLTVPAIPVIITIVAGWVVVVGAIISVILAVFNK